MTEEILLWRGQPLEELTKEELIEALKVMQAMSISQHDNFRRMSDLVHYHERKNHINGH